MKYQKAHRQLDERDKLRKFRELDDAFAQALKQLEEPGNHFDIPTGPPVRSLADLEEQERKSQAQERERLFGERLKALCKEYGYSAKAVKGLVELLVHHGRWDLETTPVVTLSGSDRPAG